MKTRFTIPVALWDRSSVYDDSELDRDLTWAKEQNEPVDVRHLPETTPVIDIRERRSEKRNFEVEPYRPGFKRRLKLKGSQYYQLRWIPDLRHLWDNRPHPDAGKPFAQVTTVKLINIPPLARVLIEIEGEWTSCIVMPHPERRSEKAAEEKAARREGNRIRRKARLPSRYDRLGEED